MSFQKNYLKTIKLTNDLLHVVFLIVFFLLCSFELSGQVDKYTPIKISGIVFEGDSLNPLPYAHFQVLGESLAGLTNSSGRFEVFVTSGDTLKFTFVGYKASYYKVQDTLNTGEYVVGVFMSRDTILIREVVVYPRRRDLRQDFMSIKAEPDLQRDNAIRNIKISSYQGIHGKQVPWDSDASYKRLSQRRKMEAFNQGMIAPDQMVGLNFLALIPYAIYKLNPPDVKKPPEDIYISEGEYKELIGLYRSQLLKPALEIKDTVNVLQ